MPFTTTVTPGTIETATGKPVPSPPDQWQMWIDDALMLINNRATELAVIEIDQKTLDYVVREAVSDHVKQPDDVTQVTISIADEGSSSRTYRSSKGRVTILDEWWTMLGLSDPTGAFSIDLLPPGYTLGGS